MNANEIPCDDEPLLAMLQRHDGGETNEKILEHVERCQRCQTRLEELAASADEWQMAGAVLSTNAAGEGDGLEESVRAFRRSRWTERSVAWTDSMAKLLLTPPTHPEMLGRLGRYDVERLIGAGGMGIVFKAFDTELNRVVAIKVLAPYLSGNGAARQCFAREARAAAAVVHDHVVPIYNVETEQASPFLVMQYVAGESLQARLDREGALSLCEILRIGMQVASGLAAAHAQGLVHRDIKPSNILLEPSIERALITDFGLARAADDASITNTGFHPGTPQYMSPEQAAGDSVDARSDLFSLGSVLYAMCAGRPPFRAESSLAVLRRIIDDRPRQIREINPAIPEWLEKIVMKLLSKSADERWSSASEVAELLEKCLAHVQQPTVHELPPSLRTERPAARDESTWKRRLQASGQAVRGRLGIGLTLLALAVVGAWGWTNVSRWLGPPHVDQAKIFGPMIECELRVRGGEGESSPMEIAHLSGVCVSEDGLVVLPISVGSLIDRSSIEASKRNSIKAIKPAGELKIVGSDERHRLTLAKFVPSGGQTLKSFKCRLALPRKGERFLIVTDRPREVAVTSVEQPYEPPLEGNDGFLVEPLHGAPIGAPIVTRDNELAGLLLQASASASRVANDELQNVNLPAVHVRNLVDAFRAEQLRSPKVAPEGKSQRIVKDIPAGGFVSRLASSPDGKQLAIVAYDHGGFEIRMVDVDSGQLEFRVSASKLELLGLESIVGVDGSVIEMQRGVSALEFSPKGDLLALGTLLGEVCVLNAQTGEVQQTLDGFRLDTNYSEAFEKTPLALKNCKRALGSVRALAFSPDGKLLAIAGDSFLDAAQMWSERELPARRSDQGGRLKVWNLEEQSVTFTYGHTAVTDVAFSSDGSFLASAGRWGEGDERAGGVILWKVGDSSPFHKLPHDPNDYCVGVRFLPDRRQIVSIASRNYLSPDSSTSVVRFTDLVTGNVEWERYVPTGHLVDGFAVDSAIDNAIGVQSTDWSFRLLNAASGDVRMAFRPNSAPQGKFPLEANWLLLPHRNWLALAPPSKDPGEGRVEIWSLEQLPNTLVREQPRMISPVDRDIPSYDDVPKPKPEGSPQELLQRLVRGGKIDTKSLDALITAVAHQATQDEAFARTVLEEFQKSCAGGEQMMSRRRDLLNVFVEFFELEDDARSINGTDSLDTHLPSPMPTTGKAKSSSAEPPKMAELKAELLALVVDQVYAASSSEIATFTMVARQSHLRDSRPFLLDVVQKPAVDTWENPFADPPTVPTRLIDQGADSQGTTPPAKTKPLRPSFDRTARPWKEPSGAMWFDVQFVAAVGLAEMGDAAGVEWLLTKVRPNDFGIDYSLWQYSHVSDQKGSLRESSRLSLCQLFRVESGTEFADLTEWWTRSSSKFRGGRVRLKLGRRFTPLRSLDVEPRLQGTTKGAGGEKPLQPRKEVNGDAERIVWGKVKDSLRAGVGYRPARFTGEPAQLFVLIRNEGQAAIRVRPRPLWLSSTDIRRRGDDRTIRGIAPAEVGVDSVRPLITLEEGDSEEIGFVAIRLDEATERQWVSDRPAKDHSIFFVSPGQFTAQFTDLLDDLPQLATGTLVFEFRDELPISNGRGDQEKKAGLEWHVGFQPIYMKGSAWVDRSTSARYLNEWIEYSESGDLMRRFDNALGSIDTSSPERLESSIDRLIAESADWPAAVRAALMFDLMMITHEWLGSEQFQHAGYDGNLFERVKNKCAMTGLSNVDEIPTGLALRFLEFATWAQLSLKTDDDPNWPAQRRLKTKLWLTQVERVRRVIDPTWNETDLPRRDNEVDAGGDPDARAEREQRREAERRKANRYNEQLFARRLLAEIVPRMEQDLIRMYARKPLQADQLDAFFKEHFTDAASQERVMKSVRLFNTIVPQGTYLKYGWPDGLAEAGAAGVPALMTAVQDKTYPSFIRYDGVWALGLIGDVRALPVLREMADEEATPEKYRDIAREFVRAIEEKANPPIEKP